MTGFQHVTMTGLRIVVNRAIKQKVVLIRILHMLCWHSHYLQVKPVLSIKVNTQFKTVFPSSCVHTQTMATKRYKFYSTAQYSKTWGFALIQYLQDHGNHSDLEEVCTFSQFPIKKTLNLWEILCIFKFILNLQLEGPKQQKTAMTVILKVREKKLIIVWAGIPSGPNSLWTRVLFPFCNQWNSS